MGPKEQGTVRGSGPPPSFHWLLHLGGVKNTQTPFKWRQNGWTAFFSTAATRQNPGSVQGGLIHACDSSGSVIYNWEFQVKMNIGWFQKMADGIFFVTAPKYPSLCSSSGLWFTTDGMECHAMACVCVLVMYVHIILWGQP